MEKLIFKEKNMDWNIDNTKCIPKINELGGKKNIASIQQEDDKEYGFLVQTTPTKDLSLESVINFVCS